LYGGLCLLLHANRKLSFYLCSITFVFNAFIIIIFPKKEKWINPGRNVVLHRNKFPILSVVKVFIKIENNPKFAERDMIEFENVRGIEVHQFEGDLNCPYCNEPLFIDSRWDSDSWANGKWAGKCPHVFYFYTWGPDNPYQLISVRSDFAADFIQKLTISERYLAAVTDNLIQPLNDDEVTLFASGNYNWGADIGASVAKSSWHFPEVAIPDSIPLNSKIFHIIQYPIYVNIAVSPDYPPLAGS
jgi:hypothetical protein